MCGSGDKGDGADGWGVRMRSNWFLLTLHGVSVRGGLLAVDLTGQLAQQLVLATLLDHNSEMRRKIRGLLANFRALVVQPPQDGRHNLRDVGLDTRQSCTTRW